MSTQKRAPALHPILSTQLMLLPSLSLLLRNGDGPETEGKSFDLNEPATSPPVYELWLVLLSHTLHLTATSDSGVTVSEVLAAAHQFWTSDVPLTWEGFSSCRRRAKKDRIKQEGKDKAEKEAQEQGDDWKFTWWESLEMGQKREGKQGEGKWEEPKVDGMGNVRLVLKGLEV
ncbi:hypothetical protein FIBSPDRAFT_862469 [Athelia psychrophila]|uniref:DUF6699 domain-containing protein n=1 Tax=Athelia psychrophila TaxID=1759441 RepID=A0A166IFR7_9AGAM|nr:hypothetical protein FIBSPDRAFT_878020 [Fibularhizoctonia sp. CBS 109695]KZP19771.1 hypothetical protein FIBSPDRAFT_862469 [Fibularhizoctonia sp. CBS 109695]